LLLIPEEQLYTIPHRSISKTARQTIR